METINAAQTQDQTLSSKAGPPPSFSSLIVKKDVPIIASSCIYRDAQFLRSSLDSYCHYVDCVVLLDGRFLDFPELPEDGTNQIISETASQFDPKFGGEQKFAVFKTRPCLEVEKRDLSFATVKPGSFVFIIDGDEICIGDVKAGLDFVREHEQDGINVFWVYVDEPKGNPGWKPRIIRAEEGLHYANNHWTIARKDGTVLTDSVFHRDAEFSKIEAFKIYNMGFSNRDPDRRQRCIEYKNYWINKNWAEREESK